MSTLVCGPRQSMLAFARPGNRRWPSLRRAGLTGHVVDPANGPSEADEGRLLSRGTGPASPVGATLHADELSREELRGGGARPVARPADPRSWAMAIASFTVPRTAFSRPHERQGEQNAAGIPGRHEVVQLRVVPQPVGLNAHEGIDSLVPRWCGVWEASEEQG